MRTNLTHGHSFIERFLFFLFLPSFLGVSEINLDVIGVGFGNGNGNSRVDCRWRRMKELNGSDEEEWRGIVRTIYEY